METELCGGLLLHLDSPLPLYYQLQMKIKGLIEAGSLNHGTQLPSERELAAMAMVNRLTVRQALSALVNEGVLVRKRGRGTFVAQPKIEHGLSKLTSFTEDMQQRGLRPFTRLLALMSQPANAKAAQELRLANSSEVIVIERLRLADDIPMALEISHLPVHRFPTFLASGFDLSTTSLYVLLRQHFGVELKRAIETLEAGIADGQVAALLGVEDGAPLLMRERTTFDEQGEPVEYVRSLYRADRYRFVFEVIA